MNVYFYKNFKKRTNSTKQPQANSQDRIIDCQLKENCSIENPILRITTGSATAGWQDTLNYAYIPSWGRYYKVEDGVYAGGNIWEIHLVDDAPASNKANILQCNAFIEYSGLSGETYVPDSRLTMRGNRAASGVSTATLPFTTSVKYYVSVINDQTVARCYQMTGSEFITFSNAVMGINGTILDQMQKQLGHVFNAVTKVIALPFNLAAKYNEKYSAIEYHTVRLGSVDIGNPPLSCPAWDYDPAVSTDICDYIYNDTLTVTIPWDNTINDFRNLPPYTSFIAWLPFYGEVELDATYMVGQTNLTLDYAVSVRDGSITYKLSCGNHVYGVYNANIAQEIAIGNVQGNPIGFMKAAINTASGTAGAIATGNAFGAMSALTGGLSNMGITAMERHVSQTGSMTGLPMKYMYRDFTLRRFYSDTVTAPSNYKATMGAPYMRVDTLSNHAGYFVKCNGASVEISHYAGEADTINNMLNSGIYLE